MKELEEILGCLFWKPRCPKCFSRDLELNSRPGHMVRCGACGEWSTDKDAELRMPVDGGLLDVPRNGTEEEE